MVTGILGAWDDQVHIQLWELDRDVHELPSGKLT